MTSPNAIDPNAIYIPREAATVSKIGLTEITAAIVRGDLKARLKPPNNIRRIIVGRDLLAWIDTLIEA